MLSSARRLKTAVMISGNGTNLQALIDADARGELAHVELCLVLSNNSDAYGLTRARLSGIAAEFIPNNGDFESSTLRLFRERGIELVVLAGFIRILGCEFINSYEGRIVNVHPSLIPSFCGRGFYGLRVHREALARGVKVSGATVHIVTADPDGGPILAQRAVEVLPNDTPEALQLRIMRQAEWQLLPQAVEELARTLVTAAPRA